MKGPRPLPTALKIARGNPGKRALNRHEPQPPKMKPEPLGCLSPAATVHYDQLAEVLHSQGILTCLDGVLLSVLAVYLAEFDEATDHVAREGAVIDGRKNPWVLIKKQAAEHIVKLAPEFGLTASARTRLSVYPKTANEWDELEDSRFFGDGRG